MNGEVYGAKALVFLKHDGSIDALAKKLSLGLVIPDFWVEAREEAPYDLVGSCEAFGMEAWLESSSKFEGFSYSIKMETEHSLHESLNGKMHDLSLWLARYIFSICKVETFVAGSDERKNVIFS